jgi:hypothetical protein
MSNPAKAFEPCPQEWIEAHDFESVAYDKATWIPLSISKTVLEKGKPGLAGYRREYQNFESIIVPIDLREQFQKVDWQSVGQRNPDHAWASDKGFFPPGCYGDDPRVLYPALHRSFETGEPTQWDLLQELEVGLQLFKKGDTWIRPDEDDVEVAKLERDAEGEPSALLFKAEHLRDYLCAKRAALLLTGFNVREAVEEQFPGVAWPGGRQERQFETGSWEGSCAAIHEGGHPFGSRVAVVRAWRESVDPEQDLPEMPPPAQDTGMKSESHVRIATGRKLHRLYGRTWVKHWILPATKSPRIRNDPVEARVPFLVENQESITLSGTQLAEYRGWLWFRPGVIRSMTERSKGSLQWYTEMTGEVGPSPNRTLHFGINKASLINVLGYQMAELPEWAQKLWAAFNVPPEGGLSEELHMSQNLAEPADTTPPEVILLHTLRVLNHRSSFTYGAPILRSLPNDPDYFRSVHRFYDASFEDVCELCKEITRVFIEQIDLGLLNSKVDPGNAAKANKERLGSLRRLALWLDSAGHDGRQMTRPLAGVYDLRIGDAHSTSGSLRKSLDLFEIARESQDYQSICKTIIGLVANSAKQIADAIPRPASPPVNAP